MVKLTPALKSYLWGGNKLKTAYSRTFDGDIISESWEVSVHEDGLSLSPEGESLLSILKKNPRFVDEDGSDLPILIKYIDAAKSLSVQVHPDDEYSQKYENDNGKTEMWYVVDADENAGIYCGFKKDVEKDDFLKKVEDGTVEELLNFIPVKKGDCFLIEAGTVHAICAGCFICEVQQSSNVTYRVYDYNRVGVDGKKRPLHVEKAMDVINFNKFEDNTNRGLPQKFEGGTIEKLTECKYFKCRLLSLDGRFDELNENSFVALNILDGEGEVNGVPFIKGDSFFIPMGEAFTVNGRAEIILSSENE